MQWVSNSHSNFSRAGDEGALRRIQVVASGVEIREKGFNDALAARFSARR